MKPINEAMKEFKTNEAKMTKKMAMETFKKLYKIHKNDKGIEVDMLDLSKILVSLMLLINGMVYSIVLIGIDGF